MVPVAYPDFFVASTGAAAAPVGLLFVAISFAPERTVARGAPAGRQAVAASSFTALVNAFFISVAALIPDLNLGFSYPGDELPGSGPRPVDGIGLVRAWDLLEARRQGLLGWLSALRNEENEEGDSTVAVASHQATPSKPPADKVA